MTFVLPMTIPQHTKVASVSDSAQAEALNPSYQVLTRESMVFEKVLGWCGHSICELLN
ncbi:hypothetical protein DICA3_A00782 [Diutina catenulata]